jgi:hypothetical protein
VGNIHREISRKPLEILKNSMKDSSSKQTLESFETNDKLTGINLTHLPSHPQKIIALSLKSHEKFTA